MKIVEWTDFLFNSFSRNFTSPSGFEDEESIARNFLIYLTINYY